MKTVGNTTADPSFLSFAATPPQATGVLAWSSPRSGSVNITNVVGAQPGPTASLDVAPDCTTVYTLDTVDATVVGAGTSMPPPVCNGNALMLFNENLSGMQTKEAERLVEAEEVTILSGANITFRAGDQVVIKSPFTVESSATFTAFTDGCLCQ